MGLRARLLGSLLRPVDAASLGVFRIVFGATMVVEVVRYWVNGWIHSYYAVPQLFFHYPFLEWVRPLSGSLLYLHFALLGLAALCIALGLVTRAAAAVFAVGFAWWFLGDRARYLNHFYLIALLSFLLVVVPTDRACSLAARARPAQAGSAPAWALWLLRFQVGVPYFFGGIAKLNADWLAGEPMRMWLRELRDFPVLGPLFAREWCLWTFVWGGLLLDLGIVPALLWRRTRPVAYLLSVAFHGLNALVFSIGVFPWLMIGATTIFFEPGWPRRLRFLRPAPGPTQALPRAPAQALVATPGRRAGLALCGLWVLFQCSFPLRHFLYPGPVSWTEEGHLFAWHMKLRDKRGNLRLYAHDPRTGRSFEIDPRDYLTHKQLQEMIGQPELLVQLARHVSREHERQGQGPLEVRARVHVGLNGRRPQLFIDPEVDLAAQPRTLGHRDWILPLTTPLRRP